MKLRPNWTIPSYTGSSPATIMLLLVSLVWLTFLVALYCLLDPQYANMLRINPRGRPNWFLFAALALMGISCYIEWRKAVALRNAKEKELLEGEFACLYADDVPKRATPQKARKRRLIVTASSFTAALVTALIMAFFPNGPLPGQKLATAATLTTAVLLVAEILFGKERDSR